MKTRIKTSVSLSRDLLAEIAAYYDEDSNLSVFIEDALRYYIKAQKKQEQVKRDMEIINKNAERFNNEAKENLLYQAPL
jgi:metal-responsive CopG/Arc/MetJ family transcriptional regulator